MIQDTSSPLGTVQALTGIPFSMVTRPCSNSELCTVHTRTARRRYVRYLINTRHPALNVRLVSKQLFSQFSKDNPRYCSRRGLRSLYLEERDTYMYAVGYATAHSGIWCNHLVLVRVLRSFRKAWVFRSHPWTCSGDLDLLLPTFALHLGPRLLLLEYFPPLVSTLSLPQ